MPELQYPHIFVTDATVPRDFTSPQSGRDGITFPDRSDRKGHADFVRKALDQAWARSEKEKSERHAVALPTRSGTYIEFEGAPGFDLKTKSLDLRQSGIRLLTVTEVPTPDDTSITRATIFVPEGKEAILLKKVDQYQKEDTEKGKPRNEPLIAGINHLKEAVLQSFWRDNVQLIPEEPDWCEVWLRFADQPQQVASEFGAVCTALNVEIKEGFVTFPERVVVMVRATRDILSELILSSDHIAEFRRAKATAEFWMNLDTSEQAQWVQSMAERIQLVNENSVSICVLDTGVNNGHVLLQPIITDGDCHTVNSDWGSADQHGHGTQMCGVAAYGDKLDQLLQSTEQIEIPYNIESVKLIPTPGDHHDKELYGLRTKQALSRAEIENPGYQRTVCLAVTSEDGRDVGRPSSWSGSIDQLAFGVDDQKKRLMIVAAGNVQDSSEWKNYPHSNITQAVHDPGQSWNALTVGAFTTKCDISDEELSMAYAPIAANGQLSPYSTTSLIWDSKWPNKPDLVLEGGNAGFSQNHDLASELDDLSILSTHHKPHESQFSVMNATSAAAAQAARMAARLVAQYPEAWPETIRALMVHSAQWTPELELQFKDPTRTVKQNQARLLRACGFGVPNFTTAIESATNSLTLICEQTIQPFQKKAGSGYETKDMHLIELPWPVQALNELPSETRVAINVTLSYFVEPGPGEIGWRDKYRYRSHGLDFDLIAPTESRDEFLKRLNKAARDGETENATGSSIPWNIGFQNRNRGSIHRDWWITTAANSAACNIVGVFPRTGWWKERAHLKRGTSQARYSLVVTLQTPSTDVDIYTPIATEVATQIAASST